MIWFSASCNFTILPNSLGLPALPLRMTSVDGSNKLRSFSSLRVLPRKIRARLLHHLPDARRHLIEFLAQALQHQLLQGIRRALHSLGNLLGEAPRLSDHPARRIQQLAIALLQFVLVDRAFGARHPSDLQ